MQAWKDLDAGKVDAAAAGLTFQDWAALMEQEGYKVEKGKYLAQVIGMDSIQIFTNKDVTVQSLNRDQVRGIFTGEITNWSQVGGPDMPIVVVLGTKIEGTLSEFKKRYLTKLNTPRMWFRSRPQLTLNRKSLQHLVPLALAPRHR